jgi:hypothetical protein
VAPRVFALPERARQGAQRARHAGAGGRLGDVQLGRHVRVRTLLDDAQPQRLAVLGRQLGQPCGDLGAQLREPGELLDPFVLDLRQPRRLEPELRQLAALDLRVAVPPAQLMGAIPYSQAAASPPRNARRSATTAANVSAISSVATCASNVRRAK